MLSPVAANQQTWGLSAITLAGCGVTLSASLQYGAEDMDGATLVVLGFCGLMLGATLAAALWALKAKMPDAPRLPWHRVTVLLSALLTLSFVLHHAVGSVIDAFIVRHLELLRLGMLVPQLVRDGQPWRVMTAPWTFHGIGHFLVAVLMVRLWASALANKQSAIVVFICFVLPPVAASALIAGLIPNGAFTLGSAGGFGLMGAVAAAEFASARSGEGARLHWVWWGLGFCIATGTALVPMAHGGAHLLSLIFGALIIGVVRQPWLTRAPAHLIAGGAALLWLVGATAGLYGAGQYAQRPTPQITQDFMRTVEGLDDTRTFNNAAWTTAKDAAAGPHILELAEALSRRAVDLAPKNVAFQDTLATLLYRRGHAMQAAEMEFRVAQRYRSRFFWSQVQRFLRAEPRPAPDMPHEMGHVRSASVAIERNGSALIMWWPQGSAATMIGQLRDEEDDVLGTVLLSSTSTVNGSERFIMPAALADALDANGYLDRVWMRDSDEHTRTELSYFPHDPDVDALP